MSKLLITIFIFLKIMFHSFEAQSYSGRAEGSKKQNFFAEINVGTTSLKTLLNQTDRINSKILDYAIGYDAVGPLKINLSVKGYLELAKLSRDDKEYSLNLVYLNFYYDLYHHKNFNFFVTTALGKGEIGITSQGEIVDQASASSYKIGCGIDYKIYSNIYFQLKYDYIEIWLTKYTELKLVNTIMNVSNEHSFTFGIRYHI